MRADQKILKIAFFSLFLKLRYSCSLFFSQTLSHSFYNVLAMNKPNFVTISSQLSYVHRAARSSKLPRNRKKREVTLNKAVTKKPHGFAKIHDKFHEIQCFFSTFTKNQLKITNILREMIQLNFHIFLQFFHLQSKTFFLTVFSTSHMFRDH